jgi:opacity protein-like surface antigen
MKKSILILTSILLCGTIQAKEYSYPDQIKGQYVSVGLEYLNSEVDRFKIKGGNPSLLLGYGYRFNRYIELGADVSINTQKTITSSFVDNSVLVDTTGTEPVVTNLGNVEYTNSMETSLFAGLHLKLTYPITDNFDIYGTVGTTYGHLSHKSYYNNDNYSFTDHSSSITNAEEFLTGVANGSDLCELTGVEASCGSPIKSYDETFKGNSFSYGAGIRWMIFDSGSVQIVNFGYKSLIDKKDFNVTSIYVNYEYQF